MNAHEEIAHLADVQVDVEVELARRVMTVREVLGLRAGSILKMARSAGENIDITVGGAPIGSGEIVIIENALGVRITDFSVPDGGEEG